MHQYKAICTNVVDGDTIDLQVSLEPQKKITINGETYYDFGFRVYDKLATPEAKLFKDRFRLKGINAPEVRGEKREAGLKAEGWLITQLFRTVALVDDKPVYSSPRELTIYSHKGERGKYGRWLVTLFEESSLGRSVNDLMVDVGHAKYVDY